MSAVSSLRAAAEEGGVCLTGAAQVLRPPEDGLPHLRPWRAEEMRLDPGAVWLQRGAIAGFEERDAGLRVDATGCAVIPGFVDCHTHLPFAGWRADEYALKVAGTPYEEIARGGGGIAASARAFAQATDDEVALQAQRLGGAMLAHGTTAYETKSGYGLSVEAELRALRLADRVRADAPQQSVSTALLAHAVPPGFTADGWMDAVEAMLPEVVASTDASALDIYVESVAFANDHLARMGALAREHGLALRAHVEQFATHRSVPVAIEQGARSVDHLACLHPDDLAALAESTTTAVLLPGAEHMGEEAVAPGRALADAGAICAIASDLNPGTSPILSMPLIIGLAVRRYGWSVREALLACTLNAAWVIARSGDLGSLEVGKRADVLLLDAPAEHVPYRLGHNPVAAVFVGGRLSQVRGDALWRFRAA